MFGTNMTSPADKPAASLRQAIGLNFADGSSMRIGSPWSSGRTPSKADPEISAITVSNDLKGLYCDMERIRVWVGDICVYEAPLHMVEGVEYELLLEGSDDG